MEDSSSSTAMPKGNPKQGQSLKGAYGILNLHRKEIQDLERSVSALIETMKQTGIDKLEQKLNHNLHKHRHPKQTLKKKNESKKKQPEGQGSPSETEPETKPSSAQKFEY